MLALLVPLPQGLSGIWVHSIYGKPPSSARPVAGWREGCFSSPVCPGRIFTQGKESRVGTTLRKGCLAHIRSLAQATSAPRARACGSGGSSGPCSPMNSALWADIASWQGLCWGGMDESPGENQWGKGSRTPPWPPCSAQLCLLLKPGPPCRGAGLCQGPRYALGSA